MPQPAQPQPRTAKPSHASLLDLGGAVGRITGILFGSHPSKPSDTAAFARHPALRILAEQTARVSKIGRDETDLMARAETEVAGGVGTVRAVLHNTGIDPDQFAQKYESVHGMGGPDVSLQSVHIEGISDVAFQNAYLKASAVLTQMDELGAMRHVPLTVPVSGHEFERTSGFGARVDPFTGRYAFHPGVDFAGPWGALVHSTAPGTVVWAGDGGGDTEIWSRNGPWPRNPYPLRAICQRFLFKSDAKQSQGRAGRKTRIDRPQHRPSCPL